MINHHLVLKQQLKKIGNNINKKYATLRKQILKTSEVFDNEQIPVFPYEVCFGLFRQIAEAGSLSSSLSFFPFLQNIINLGFSNAQMSRQILTLLTHTKSIPKFFNLQNQTKMQQILAVLVSKNCIDLNNLGFTHSLFNVVLSLQNTKHKSVWYKSSSILYQTLLLLVNDVKESQTVQKYNILGKFLSDLIRIIMGQQPQWLIQFADSYLILQVLCQALDDKFFFQNLQSKYKQPFSQLQGYIKKQMRKCVQNGLSLMNNSKLETGSLGSINLKSWQLTNENKILILMRVNCKINIQAKIGLDILQQVIKIISDKRQTIYKAIAYQGMNYLFRNSSWMLTLFQSQFADLFNFLLTTQFNTIKYLLSEQKEKIDLVYFFTGPQTNFAKIMGSNLIDINIIDFGYSHQVKMIVKNLEQVTYALYAIYSQKYKIDMNQKIEGKPPIQKTYKFCQKTVFQTIKTILSKQMSQDTLQSLLKISQKFINMSGCFNDSSVSAIYIKLMCKYCLPAQFKNIDHRHIQINKMILNTANCLGHLFTSSCWVIVWKTLQNYSIYYNRYLLGKEELQSARQSDVQILYKSMDSIFTQSPKYNDKYLLQIIRSLVQVAYECLQNNYNDDTRKIFAFQRIQQIYRLNLFRVCIIWPQLSSSLLCITTSKVLYFRLSALSLLNTLIPLSLNYIKNHQQVIKPPFTQQNYEQLLLEPWMNLVNCQFQQIKDEFVLAVNKLIIDYGHIMTNGWKCIMQIVKKTNDLKSLQAIVQTFLQKVHDHIMDVTISVDAIQRKLEDTNHKYLCLTMIWSIADYARKNNQFQVLKKIYQILLVPQQMFNLGTEARHSSFYIFAQIVVHNCVQKSPQFWLWIFQQIKIFYTYGVNQCINAKNKTFAEQALKNIITNLIKIYKKFFLVSKQWQQKSQVSLRLLGDFYNFCGKVLQFRSPQIYQNLIKQTKQLLYPKIKESLSIKQFYTFLQNLAQIYFVQNDSKILKCLITYLPPDIYDLLGFAIEGLDKNFIVMYRLVEKIYLLRLQALQKDIKLSQYRIFFQQKYHYQYMKKMQQYISEEKPALVPIYVQNLCKTIHKLKLYQDYPSLSKNLPFLTNIHIKYPDVLFNMVLDTYRQIIKIRTQDNWIKYVIGTASSTSNKDKDKQKDKDIPVWYICSQDLMKITYEYINRNLPQAKITYQILRQLLNQDISSKLQGYSKDSLCNFYQNQLQMCYFLIENYYFTSKEETQNQIKQIDSHIQQISRLILKRSQQIDNEDYTRKGYNAFQLLFKLSQGRQQESYSKNLCLQDRQSIIAAILFERILSTFNRVLGNKKQNSNNSVTIPNGVDKIVPSQVQQLKFLLKQMRSLQMKPRIIKKMDERLKSNKAFQLAYSVDVDSLVLRIKQTHLFYFQPLIVKCIKCEDAQTLQIIQNILQKNACLLLKTQEKQIYQRSQSN